jgi:hypothetical protein
MHVYIYIYIYILYIYMYILDDLWMQLYSVSANYVPGAERSMTV